jgi:uncharacterized protein
MKISMVLGGVIACLILSSASAKAASFNCYRQLPPDMRMICDDPGLSAKDDQAAYLYNQLTQRVGPTGMAAMQQQRIGFLRVRGACGMNRRCMRAAYDDQIQSLRAMFRQRGYPAPGMAMTRPY